MSSTQPKLWKLDHHGRTLLEIVEGEKGYVTATIKKQRTTTHLLRLPPSRDGLTFEEKVRFMIKALYVLLPYLNRPSDIKSYEFKKVINTAYDTVIGPE